MASRALRYAWTTLSLAFVCTAPALPAHAQGEASQSVAFYALGLASDGVVAAGDAAASIDLSTSDFFDQLEWGSMGSYRYAQEGWSVQIDAIYATLVHDTESGVRAELEQSMIEVDGGYRLNDFVELVIGVRGWDYEVHLTAVGPGGAPASGSDSWTDPLLGARFSVPLGERWDLVVRADVGGFGVGSDFTWHATAAIGWHAGDSVRLLAGYRIFDLDYESDHAADGIRIDLQQRGPAIGAALAF